MPWHTPDLTTVRGLVRDYIRAMLPGSDAAVPNSVLRVLSDVMGALCHLTLQYVDWIARQMMPDLAEAEWLDRWAAIYLVNADSTVGRKQASLASGSATFTGTALAVVPSGTQLVSAVNAIGYETLNEITIDPNAPTPALIRALDPGADGNLPIGTALALGAPPPGVDNTAIVVELDGGTDTETDDELRSRLLKRIRNPPMGGDKNDWEQWALAVNGVTRAWCAPNEQGIGTAVLRFMCDDLRADNQGFPNQSDIDRVTAYIDQMRPVTVMDRWILSPIPQRIDVYINNLVPETDAVKGAIEASLNAMLFELAAPGETIFAAWKSFAVMNAAGVVSFSLLNTSDDVMPSKGHLAILGDIYYEHIVATPAAAEGYARPPIGIGLRAGVPESVA